MHEAKTVAVVMPAYNESAVIGSVLARIPSQIASFDVISIVVDDGSTDSTADIARRQGAFVVRHLTNLGVGAATVTGLRAARALNPDVIVTMDADGQHDPQEIEALVQCLIDGPFDVVIGSRLLNPKGMPPTRIAANLLLNAVTYFVYGKIVSDSQSGFKAFSRHATSLLPTIFLQLNGTRTVLCARSATPRSAQPTFQRKAWKYFSTGKR